MLNEYNMCLIIEFIKCYCVFLIKYNFWEINNVTPYFYQSDKSREYNKGLNM